jgi:tetratricopeptide (TPR) repeat protein
MGRFLLIVVLALCGCRSGQHLRTIRVRVAADEKFRARPNWKEVASARLAAINPIFAPMGVRWEMGVALDWVADPGQTLEGLRRQMAGYIGPDAIALGMLSGPRGGEMGAANPFDPRLLVVDQPDQPEARNQAILAHQLGLALGAWPSADAYSFMHTPPGSAADATSTEVIRITHAVDFLKGADGLTAESEAALTKLWKESKAPAGTHPLAIYWSQIGDELLSKNKAVEAVEPLTKAASYAPDDVKIRLAAGLALGAARRFPAAVHEFQRASELDPNSVIAFNSLGGVLAKLQRWDEAAAAFRKAVALAPKDVEHHLNLGMVLINTPGKLEEAIAELEMAERIDPANQTAAKALTIARQRRKYQPAR